MTKKFFRPSLVIFLDDVGKQIYEQFSAIMLLYGLAASLRECVGLMHYTFTPADEQVATYRLASDVFATDRHAADSPSGAARIPSNETTTIHIARLEESIEHMQQSVSVWLDKNKEKKEKIENAGYSTSTERIQIYIIGHANSDSMKSFLNAERERVFSLDPTKEADVYILLCPNPKGSSNLILDGIVYHTDPLVKFSYVFERMPGEETTERVSHNVIAQTLYALIATGITSQDAFEREILPQSALNGDKQIGCLLTNCIIFPRESLVDYGSSRIGTELLQQWSSDIRKGSNPKEKEVQRNGAQDLMKKVAQMLRESSSHPKDLFDLISLKSLDEEFKNRKASSDTLADVIDKVIDKKAQKNYEGWKAGIEQRKNEVDEHIKETVNRILSSSINGYCLIKAYLEECRRELASLLDNQGKQLKDAYQNDVENFAASLGISANMNYHHWWRIHLWCQCIVTLGSFGQTSNYQQYASNDQLPPEVKDLAKSLQHRFASERTQIPSVLTVIATCLLAAPPLILIVLALLPTWPTLLVIGVVGGLILLSGMSIYWQQRRKVMKMRKAFIKLYHLCLEYLYKYEAYDRDLKDTLGGMFNRKLQAEDERLQKISIVTSEVETELEKYANTILKNSFNSSQATRDVFIDGNGDILVDAAAYVKNNLTLQKLAESNAQHHKGKSKSKYSRSQFIKSFHNHLLEIATKNGLEAQRHVLDLVRDPVDRYLEDRSLAKATALSDQVWKKAFSQVEDPPARSLPNDSGLLFICSGNQGLVENGKVYVQQNMHKEAIAVHTDSSECCIIAAFFRSSSTISHVASS